MTTVPELRDIPASTSISRPECGKPFAILALALTLGLPSARAAGLVTGLWEFDDENHPGHATAGDDLEFLGSAPGAWFAKAADDGGKELSGVITTPAPAQQNQIIANHNIPPNGGGQYVNRWSFLADIYSPEDSRASWRSLLQTHMFNTNDADFVIHPADDTIGIGAIGYSTQPLDEAHWVRLVVTVELPPSGTAIINSYANGTLLYEHRNLVDGFEGRFALDPRLQFFSDEDGENAPLSVGAVAVFDDALMVEEVAALGSAGDTIPRDTDDDGLADSSEMRYFGSLTATDGTGDSDHDGTSDAAELRLGLNPNDSASAFRLDITADPEAGSTSLAWPSRKGCRFDIYRGDRLDHWTLLTTVDHPRIADTTVQFTDPAAGTFPRVFYKVMLKP